MEVCNQWMSETDGSGICDDAESDSGKPIPVATSADQRNRAKCESKLVNRLSLSNHKEKNCQAVGAKQKEETNRCTFCGVCFTKKKKLLNHLKESHGVLQPYQCMSCSKRFANHSSLCQHRKSYCKKLRMGTENVNEYTLPAFLINVRTENWIPTYGDALTCCIIGDDDVQVLYAGNVVGGIPHPLRTTFSNFMTCGTIHAKVAGAVINRGFGEKVPVDYLFISNKTNVKNVISELESC